MFSADEYIFIRRASDSADEYAQYDQKQGTFCNLVKDEEHLKIFENLFLNFYDWSIDDDADNNIATKT